MCRKGYIKTMAKQKFSLYGLFHPSRDGKGVPKTDTHPRTLKYFFPFAWRNIGILFTVNMMLVLGNFPLLVTMYGLTGQHNISITTADSLLFGPIWGIWKLGGSTPANMALFGVHGVQTVMSVQTPLTRFLLAFGLLALFTFGVVNVGTAYILRNLVKGEPVFIWNDFRRAVRKNWKQAIPMGILDGLMMIIVIYDIFFFSLLLGTGGVTNALMFGAMVVVAGVYLAMRSYVYVMMSTFKLKFYKLLKNAFIFSILGFKRNIMAIIGVALVLFFNYYLLGVFLPLGVVLPFCITFALIQFMGIYAAYPKIKEIMIDPYYDSDQVNPTDLSDVEQVFTDRG